jgi:serine/threonine-protein kinase
MGAVWRAYDTLLRRDVALKVLSDDREARARLLREARAAAALKHPNAVAVFDVGEHEDTTFIAMEVIEGRSLRRFVGDSSVALDKKLRWLHSIADVLGAAHRAGLVHRDIKPENVMVCADDTIKVLDFGIAKRAADVEQPAPTSDAPASFRTADGRITGTPRYMAPEQKTGGAVDGRTDQYAWGLVACELLTGVHAHKGDIETLLAGAAIPDTIVHTILRALCGRASDRFDSMDDIVQQLAPSGSRSEPKTPAAVDPPIFADRTEPMDAATDTTAERASSTKVDVSPPKRRALLLGAIAVAAIAAALVAARPHHAEVPIAQTPDAGPLRVAVLPLDAAACDDDHRYLGDELAGELIGELSHDASLRVVARASVMRYRADGGGSIADAARDLAVARLVTGTIRTDGDTLRVSLELVDASTRAVKWSQSYTSPIADVGRVVREAALGLRGAFGLGAGVPARKHTPAPAAYASYLRGRYFFNQRSETAANKAIASFDDAIKLDPDYADPYVGLADTHEIMSTVFLRPLAETEPPVMRALERALELDPSSSPAHVSKANALETFRWAWEEAGAEYRRGVELDPSNAQAHEWYGEHLSLVGRREEAVAEMQRALDLDPASPAQLKNFGMVLYYARRYAEAETILRRGIEMDDKQAYIHYYLGVTLAELGRRDEAMAAIKRNIVDIPQVIRKDYLRFCELHVQVRTGHPEAAKPLLRQLDAALLPGAMMAWAYALAGDAEKMFVALRQSIDKREVWGPFFNVAPVFDPYRSDPRFDEVRKRAGFIR